ncbi:MAG TPA: DUF4350 domain-containing protein [Longimicrobium sp.]|jgi:hypothetical protein|nr:DUF4350 domain-containing protein [Longimicrobium sp.]
MRSPTLLLTLAAAAALASTSADAQQGPDTTWVPTVPRPAYAGNGPRVGIDEAHLNFHTATGNYRPFAALLRADGYRVSASTARFTRESLAAFDVLVVANARGGTGLDAFSNPAFTAEECTAVREWVRAGGSLLLIADHAPFGTAAEPLSLRFGVDMSKGWAFDTARGTAAEENRSFLRYDRENGLLGSHPILQGRDGAERVSKVVAFTGQSLSIPAGADVLLRLSPTAQDRQPPTREELQAQAASRQRMVDSVVAALRARGGADSTAVRLNPMQDNSPQRFAPAAGRAQGLALTVGSGRVVILGEAAMLSAQVVNLPGREPMRMGMNVPGHDDQQFALNVLHWLSRLY